MKKIWEKIPKMVKFWFGAVLLTLAAIILGYTALMWKNYPHDNIIEEIVEEVIQQKTGLDIDLTPMSPEIGIQRFD